MLLKMSRPARLDCASPQLKAREREFVASEFVVDFICAVVHTRVRSVVVNVIAVDGALARGQCGLERALGSFDGALATIFLGRRDICARDKEGERQPAGLEDVHYAADERFQIRDIVARVWARGERDVAFEAGVGPAFFRRDMNGIVALAVAREIAPCILAPL